MKSAIALVAVALAYSAFGCQPVFRIYQSRYGEEKLSEVLIVIDETNTTHRGINVTGADIYTCAEGVFLGYQWEAWGGESSLVSGVAGDINRCQMETEDRQFKSVKVVGAPDDYTASALVTYLNSNNGWADFTYLQNTEQLNSTRFNSLILMGHEEVEIFSQSSYQGDSFCVRPHNGMIHSAEEFDGINDRLNGTELYTDLLDLSAILGRTEFHSFRFGCSSV